MPKNVYTAAQKAEAVAYARIEGWRNAAQRLGIDPRTVREWSVDAGVPLELNPDALAAAGDLALAKITNEIASGKLTGTRLATVLGIIQDKRRLRDRDQPKVATGTTALQAREELTDWLVDGPLGDEHTAHLPEHPTEAQWEAATDALERDVVRVWRELLRRAKPERGQPHRLPLLVWFAGKDDRDQPVQAADVLVWSKAHVTRLTTATAAYAPPWTP